MARQLQQWTFECPQFVDFEAGLESSGRDDIFFDCKDHQSPVDGIFCKTPAASNEKEHMTEDDEDKLLDKMTAALSILENTPTIKKSAVKGKLFSEKFHQNFSSQILKSTFKCKTVAAPPARLRRSRSTDRLNRVVTGNASKTNLRRSSSLHDVATLKRKYPVTPMCLKRTITKAKNKIIKSTEEMELEEIAKLQQALKDHLRYNEMNLKRMGLKPRPCASSKTQTKPENLKQSKSVTMMKKSTVAEKETRRNIYTLPPAAIKNDAKNAVKNDAKKLENIINNRPVSCKKMVKEADVKKSNNSVSSTAVIAEPEKSIIQRMKKPTGRILDHSGLLFRPRVKSATTMRPFRFDSSFQNKLNEAKEELSVKQKEMSHAKIFSMYDGKENVRPQSTITKSISKPLENAICDLNKLFQSNKIIEKRKGTPLKDVPVSDNFARN